MAINSNEISSFTCPNCSAPLKIVEGKRIVKCIYCNENILIYFEDYIPRYYFKVNNNKSKIVSHALTQLRETELLPRSWKVKVNIVQVALYYIPFLNYYSLNKIQKEEDDNFNLHDVSINIPLHDNDKWGLTFVPLSGYIENNKDNLLNFSHEDIIDKGWLLNFEKEKIPQMIKKIPIRGETIVEQKKIIYFPVWVVTYSVFDRVYWVSIDDYSGKILKGKAPYVNKHNVLIALILFMLAAFGIGKILRFFVSLGFISIINLISPYSFVLILILTIFCYVFLASGWNILSYDIDRIYENGRVYNNYTNMHDGSFVEKYLFKIFNFLEKVFEVKSNKW